MKRRKLLIIFLLLFVIASCKTTETSGYDIPILDAERPEDAFILESIDTESDLLTQLQNFYSAYLNWRRYSLMQEGYIVDLRELLRESP